MLVPCRDMLLKNPQKVIHIEPPFEKHWEMVLKRFDEKRENQFGEEADMNSLTLILGGYNFIVEKEAEK